jgi:tripartite-type tricarboxylate transporter receptor subunit TctC
MFLNHLTKKLVLGAAILVLACRAFGQSYPTKPINIVVPYPAGGASDFVARLFSKEMTSTLKQPILVDNVTGVGGALGVMKTLNAAPDGYTMVISDIAALITTPLTNVNAKYKPDEIKTVAMLGQSNIMLVVRKDLTVNNMSELIALAKKSKDRPLSFCTSGIGSNYHLMLEKFNAIADTKLLHVPYNGFPQCMTNLIGQQIDVAFLPIAGPFPGFVDSGAMKILAIAGSAPAPRFPKAPLMKATKGFEDFVFSAWAGFHVSNKVPDEVVLTLNKAAMAAMETSEVKNQLATTGSQLFEPMSPAQAHAHYLREVVIYQAIAKSINLQQQ